VAWEKNRGEGQVGLPAQTRSDALFGSMMISLPADKCLAFDAHWMPLEKIKEGGLEPQ